MIVYGWNSSHLKSEHLKEVACPHCQNTDGISISVFGKYAHIFWIPTFPIGKEGVSECQHCKHTMKEKEMPDNFKHAFKAFKSTLKTPVWHFSGLMVVALIVGWFMWSGSQNDKENLTFIDAPLSGDVYHLKTETGNYTTAKVVAVEDDSVYVVFNKFEINKSSQVESLDEPDNYEPEEYSITKEDLLQLLEDGEITDVDR